MGRLLLRPEKRAISKVSLSRQTTPGECRAASLRLYTSAVGGRADPTHVALWATFTRDTDENKTII